MYCYVYNLCHFSVEINMIFVNKQYVKILFFKSTKNISFYLDTFGC